MSNSSGVLSNHSSSRALNLSLVMQPQPHFAMANTIYQELTVDDGCHSPTLHTPAPLKPNQSDHHLLQHYHYSQFQHHPQKQQLQKELCHEYQHVHQLCQHPLQFQPSQQQEQPPSLGESTTTASFWKAFNTVLSDATEKQHQLGNENKRCLVSENLGELEAVYILAQSKETTQSGPDSALAVENSHTVVNNVSATAAIGVDNNVFTSEEHASMRRAKKKKRKKKVEKEMGLMTTFFKRLVKHVINHQEVLQNTFLEVIERMDRERAEREAAWRRKESEIYERETIAKAHERDLASKRESCIVSSIEKITGQSFILVSGNTRNQLSTIHEN